MGFGYILGTVGITTLPREPPTNKVLCQKVIGINEAGFWNGKIGIPNKSAGSLVANGLAKNGGA
jgi:hypothetical protein